MCTALQASFQKMFKIFGLKDSSKITSWTLFDLIIWFESFDRSDEIGRTRVCSNVALLKAGVQRVI